MQSKSEQTISQMQKSKDAEIDKLKREFGKFTSDSLKEKEQEIAQLKERLTVFEVIFWISQNSNSLIIAKEY